MKTLKKTQYGVVWIIYSGLVLDNFRLYNRNTLSFFIFACV